MSTFIQNGLYDFTFFFFIFIVEYHKHFSYIYDVFIMFPEIKELKTLFFYKKKKRKLKKILRNIYIYINS